MPAERSNQKAASATPRFSSPSSSGFATPSSSSRAPHPPVSLLSRAHGAIRAARDPLGSSDTHGAGPRDRLRRGFSIFKDDFMHRRTGDGYGHVLEEDEVVEEVYLDEDRPGGVAYKDASDLESADIWLERDGEAQAGPADKDVRMYLRRKRRMKSPKDMGVAHYLPFLNWVRHYNWSYVRGDFIAALTMASLYIPMALSLAANLGHVPAINGLYSFVFNPIIYALLGSCPQLVVGPEAAGSLLVGTVIKTSIDRELSGEEDLVMHARIAGVVTGMAGAVIFIAGMMRLGFLEGILSRPFLRGFISGIGFVIFVDQLIPQMGLSHRAKALQASHGSSVEKLVFLAENISHAHGPTCAVAFGSFAIIMVLRTIKKKLQPRYPSVAYVPDRFIIVVLSIVFSWKFQWESYGLGVLGNVQPASGFSFSFHWPFIPAHMQHVREAMGTSFLIAMLGFFESSVAAKTLSGAEAKSGGGIPGMTLTANRELVALGVANLVGGCFMALPAFGGYARSKVNASTGGRTPMSSVFLSLLTLICVLFLLPYFYYLPKAVLSALISVVAYTLIEEAPHDIKFFIRIRGWSELLMMLAIFTSTIFYSLALGIALGFGLSLLSIIRHATKPRIQILGKVPGMENQFENAEHHPEDVEFIEGCLIVKIPEPLTFANTGDLKTRLKRLEAYATNPKRTATRRGRHENNSKNIIFDIHGVTALDGSGAQVLTEIVESYVARGVRVFFCRVPVESSPVFRMFEASGIVEKCGGRKHFVASVEKALSMTMMETLSELYQDDPPEDDGLIR